jgi:hypothetical protein
MPETPPPTLVDRALTPPPEPLPVLMGRVLADVKDVGKTEKAPAQMGGYSFRGIEAILGALKPALANHGVFCLPKVLERRDGERSVSGSKTMFVVDLWLEWTFYGPAGDTLTTDAWGQGTDMGDKSLQKAATSAYKTMLAQAFCIGDSGSDSERHSVPDTEHRTAHADARTEGWLDAEHEHEAHSALADRLAQLPVVHPVRQTARKARDDHGWPMPAKRLRMLADLVAEAERDERAGGPDTALPADSGDAGAGGDQPAPEGTLGHLQATFESLDATAVHLVDRLFKAEGIDLDAPVVTTAQATRALEILSVEGAPR